MKALNPKRLSYGAVSMALLLLWADASANESASKEGYLTDTWGTLVRNNYGECWRMGYWTPAMAIAECESCMAEPEPEPEPEPAAAAPTLEAVTLSSEALFDFDRAAVRPESAQRLTTEVVERLAQYPEVNAVQVTGHTDLIGSETYNLDLSERRANAVVEYLVSQGVDANLISAAGKGESEPVVSCDQVKGPENRRNQALIECLQPNRRAAVEVQAQERKAAE